MRNPPKSQLPTLLLLLIVALIFSKNGEFVRTAAAGKRRIEIPDDLDDVIDDEEDDAWKEWGKKSTPSLGFDPPPSDLANMDVSHIQAEMMKRHSGPVFGFVKLILGVPRTPDMVSEIAMKWTKFLRTGAMGVRFMGVDRSTIMFNMEQGQDMMELKEFILNQPEAYEIKIGDRAFRRPGDPPVEEVIEKLRNEKNMADDRSQTEDDANLKEEL
ncbi:Mesd domain-containing protein [Cephalotus follicularis]|uniref:Mesd domain-containing protein n=1 Tax=Cephalotus follicularis TaxID=3775 RepID=A0A1Q3CNC0_CEPFO|nr:Mesd domain-containing protein [Cephalotus follicularis]